jgi:hypothetical protein
MRLPDRNFKADDGLQKFVAPSSHRELLMLNNFKIQHPKSWAEIARQLEKESDPDRVCALSKELMAAIDAQVGPPPKKAPNTVKLDTKSTNSGDC